MVDEWRFVSLLKESSIAYVENQEVLPAVHFTSNLRRIKEVYISWSFKNKVQEFKDIVDIELLLVESFNKMGFGFSFVEDKSYLVEMEMHKRKFLLDRENEAR